jgi:hypothetical protein
MEDARFDTFEEARAHGLEEYAQYLRSQEAVVQPLK